MKQAITDGMVTAVKFIFVWVGWDSVLFNLGRLSLPLCTLGVIRVASP